MAIFGRFFLVINKKVIYFTVFLLLLTWAIVAEYKQYSVIPASAHQPIYQGSREGKRLALAINIDWGEEYLPAILEDLAAKKVKVTFFVTGAWMRKNPLLLQEIVARGHEVGNHGFSHKDPTHLSDGDLVKLIEDTGILLKNLCNIEMKLFAPPAGAVNDRVAKIAASLGYETIMWTIDTIDWQRPAPEVIIDRVIGKLEPGAIILAHPTAPTQVALPKIIEISRARGYEFVTVGEIIK